MTYYSDGDVTLTPDDAALAAAVFRVALPVYERSQTFWGEDPKYVDRVRALAARLGAAV